MKRVSANPLQQQVASTEESVKGLILGALGKLSEAGESNLRSGKLSSGAVVVFLGSQVGLGFLLSLQSLARCGWCDDFFLRLFENSRPVCSWMPLPCARARARSPWPSLMHC